MRYLKQYNHYHQTNEGWKENLLVAFTLATNVAFANPPQTNQNNITKIETVHIDDRKMFFSACLQLSQELKNDNITFEQRKGLTEAGAYFQSMRDGVKPEQLSEEGLASVKSVESLIMEMSSGQVEQLARLGETAQLRIEIVGK